jgi:DNA-binding NarL/FixJ family response regulator
MAHMKYAKVFIADDNLLFRMGLKAVLEMDSSIKVVGEARDGAEVLENVLRIPPDVILIDIEMPRLDGVGLLTEFGKRGLSIPCLVLSQNAEFERVKELVELNIRGHVLKNESSEHIINAVRCIANGGRYFSPEIAERYFDILGVISVNKNAPVTKAVDPPSHNVSPRELQIARLIAEGLSNRNIALTLGCSEHTVKCHKANLMRKIGVQNSAEVVAWTARTGLI